MATCFICDSLFEEEELYLAGNGGAKLEIYFELFLIINFIVDYLLLLGAAIVTGFPLRYKRIVYAAVVGSLYGGICILPGVHWFGGVMWRIVVLILISCIAYGSNLHGFRCCGVFLILTFSLGGIFSGRVGIRWSSLLAGALTILLLCRVGVADRVGGQKYVKIEISYCNRIHTFIALIDTGNTLRDPISGEQVIVIGSAAAQKILGLEMKELEDPIYAIQQKCRKGFRLIPFSSIGGQGFLLATRFSDVSVNGTKRSAVVAFAPKGLDGKTGYDALIGGV